MRANMLSEGTTPCDKPVSYVGNVALLILVPRDACIVVDKAIHPGNSQGRLCLSRSHDLLHETRNGAESDVAAMLRRRFRTLSLRPTSNQH